MFVTGPHELVKITLTDLLQLFCYFRPKEGLLVRELYSLYPIYWPPKTPPLIYRDQFRVAELVCFMFNMNFLVEVLVFGVV